MLKRIRALLGRRGKSAAAETQEADQRAAKRGRPSVRRGPKVVHLPIAVSDLDPDAVKIVRRLARFDHRAYFVGGCVRDLLLERKPKDFDIGTSATPRQIKRLFRNCRIIGRRFRLAHIYFQNGKIIEVATFRALDGQNGDGGNEDGDETSKQDLLIRDDNVFGTPEEDALRRDFTINQLFYDLGEETVLDHADGLADLRRKLVRTIGDPDIRFQEDPIRILRAIKFAARLDFQIEKETAESLRRNRHELDKAATPRILEEINRFCRGGAARRSFELLEETGMFEVVFPEIGTAYAKDEQARGLMLELLARMDGLKPDVRSEIRTGEIFVALALPRLRTDFGWADDGTATRPQGLNVRQTIEDVLRPMAVRLRIPRREQEHCRQVLSTLYRMVPARRIRRNTRRAILARESLPYALASLALLAKRHGGEFESALTYWTTARNESPAAPGAEKESPSAGRGRRRSRRKPAAGRTRAADGGRQRARPAAETSKKADMPPKWDDDYFFAALPSAPEDGSGDTEGDRYGADAVAPRGGATEPPAGTAREPEAAAPAKRKRRRRRRRKPAARKTDSNRSAGGDRASGKGDSESQVKAGAGLGAMITYRHTQVGTYLILGLAGMALVLGVAGSLLGTLGWMLPAMTLLALLSALFGSLTTEIGGGELRCRFGIGLIRKRFELNRVVRVETVRNSWIWGWGIRYTPHGWLYNVSGLQAVELTLQDGRRLRIGTDEPAELAQAIREAIGSTPGRA